MVWNNSKYLYAKSQCCSFTSCCWCCVSLLAWAKLTITHTLMHTHTTTTTSNLESIKMCVMHKWILEHCNHFSFSVFFFMFQFAVKCMFCIISIKHKHRAAVTENLLFFLFYTKSWNPYRKYLINKATEFHFKQVSYPSITSYWCISHHSPWNTMVFHH